MSKMPIKKWLTQYLIAWPLLFGLFAVVQYLKGHPLDYALTFGWQWASISLVIFALTRGYYFHKNKYCPLCDD